MLFKRSRLVTAVVGAFLLCVVVASLSLVQRLRASAEEGTATYDAGTFLVDPGESSTLSHRFPITNRTGVPQFLKVTSRSCTCTEASLEESVIEPGKTGHLSVSVHPRAEIIGTNVKVQLEMTSDAIPTPRKRDFVITYRSPGRVSPSGSGPTVIDIGQDGKGEATIRFRCHQFPSEPQGKVFARSLTPTVELCIEGSSDPRIEQELRTWEIVVRCKAALPNARQRKRQDAWIEVGYGDFAAKMIVVLRPKWPVEPIPTQLYLRKGTQSGLQADLTLRSDSPINILKVVLMPEGRSLSFEPQHLNERTQRIRIVVAPEHWVERSELEITTSHSEQPILHIPVYTLEDGAAEPQAAPTRESES